MEEEEEEEEKEQEEAAAAVPTVAVATHEGVPPGGHRRQHGSPLEGHVMRT